MTLLRWLQRTPVQTFLICPLIVAIWELVAARGSVEIQPLGLLLMIWGYAQYRFVGGYRHPKAGGTAGMDVMPDQLVATGPYRWTRNPMYLGHIIFLAGLALTFWSLIAVGILVLRAMWFHHRVLHDEARLRSRFGGDFDAYCKRVSRWVPGLF